MAEFILLSGRKCFIQETSWMKEGVPGHITFTEVQRSGEFYIETNDDEVPDIAFRMGQLDPQWWEGENNVETVEFTESGEGVDGDWDLDALSEEERESFYESDDQWGWLDENGWYDSDGEMYIVEIAFLEDQNGNKLGSYDKSGFHPAEGSEQPVAESLVRMQVLAGLIR